LQEQGYTKVLDMVGGIKRWAQQVEPGMPQY
jgi:rhodanese-related sulfurtransferase